jgi:hypothetical protein
LKKKEMRVDWYFLTSPVFLGQDSFLNIKFKKMKQYIVVLRMATPPPHAHKKSLAQPAPQ